MTQKDLSLIINKLVDLKTKIIELDREYQASKIEVQNLFDKQNRDSIKTENNIVFCNKKIDIEYNVEKIIKNENLSKEIKKDIINNKIVVSDFKGLSKLLKSCGVSKEDFFKYIDIEKEVDKEKIRQLHNDNILDISELKDCYNATVVKSLVIKPLSKLEENSK